MSEKKNSCDATHATRQLPSSRGEVGYPYVLLRYDDVSGSAGIGTQGTTRPHPRILVRRGTSSATRCANAASCDDDGWR